jgi:TRAP transporter TAXI family solute receptor
MIRKQTMAVTIVLLVFFISMPSCFAAAKFKINPTQLTVAAGSTGGSWFIISTAFFSLFGDNIEGLSYSIIPGGGVANSITVNRKDAHFGMGYSTNLWAAYYGKDPYKEKFTNNRAIANLNVASVLHPWILRNTGFTNIREIANKKYKLKVDTGPRGTGGELAAQRCLALHGASYENIKAWGGSVTHSSYTEATDRMQDGHIEAFINDDIVGIPVFIELSQARDVVLMPQDPEVIKKMAGEYGYTPTVIPANIYKGQTREVPTTAQSHVFFCHKDMPDDLVYQMTKLIFTSKSRLVATHKLFEKLNPAVGPKDLPIELHPGAARYYKEIGVLK